MSLGTSDAKFLLGLSNRRIRTQVGLFDRFVVFLGLHVRSGVSGAGKRSRIRASCHSHEHEFIAMSEQVDARRQCLH